MASRSGAASNRRVPRTYWWAPSVRCRAPETAGKPVVPANFTAYRVGW